MQSTDDDRTKNNTMRHQYRVLTDREKELVSATKDLGEKFLQLLDVIGPKRETSLAKTKVEEAVMWAVKAITE